jgi:hypothetical protein
VVPPRDHKKTTFKKNKTKKEEADKSAEKTQEWPSREKAHAYCSDIRKVLKGITKEIPDD